MESPKVTRTAGPVHGRWYSDASGAAFAMELLGQRWSMLIVRELLSGGRRFTDLRNDLPGISAKVLTERLATLEEGGVVTRRQLEAPARGQVYELTEWGASAEPAIQELTRWASQSPDINSQLPLSTASLMLELKAALDPLRTVGVELRIGFGIGRDKYLAELQGGTLEVERGRFDRAQAIFYADSAAPLAELFMGDATVDALEEDEIIEIFGKRDLALQFVTLFSTASEQR